MAVKLDGIDILILNNLQKNGRMTNSELANRAGISAPPCLRRLKNLENKKVIMGYRADIDRFVVGYNFAALCLVSIIKQSTQYFEDFVNYIRTLDKVRKCFSTAGDFDFILEVISKDFADYEKFLTNYLKTFENIEKIKTYVMVSCNKNEKGVPIGERD
ncbi:MAG: Lrp/AsnC family transcriptional regulator [Holosporales bacterium]|jgi:DNA-binding Lrp family transcriptional regulator|nr:Lrp/AsnC family transcriptional regulator [Holosporales bacterium]